jgi:hypothetical protein
MDNEMRDRQRLEAEATRQADKGNNMTMTTTKKKTFPKIKVYKFGPTPDVEFEKGNILAGFNEDDLGMDDYKSARSLRLYKALGLSTKNPGMLDEEMVLGSLPGGRWALVGLTVDGHEFAVEVRRKKTTTE